MFPLIQCHIRRSLWTIGLWWSLGRVWEETLCQRYPGRSLGAQDDLTKEDTTVLWGSLILVFLLVESFAKIHPPDVGFVQSRRFMLTQFGDVLSDRMQLDKHTWSDIELNWHHQTTTSSSWSLSELYLGLSIDATYHCHPFFRFFGGWSYL